MISLCLFFAILSDPVLEIKMDNKQRYLPDVYDNRVILCKDNSYIGMATFQVWHWDKDGKLLNVIGARGEGPGEFMHITTAVWNGEYYWVVDGRRLSSSVFDRNGKFLQRYPFYFRQLFYIGDDLFSVDYSKVRPEDGNYPTTLQKLNFGYTQDGTLNVSLDKLRFKKVSPMQKNFYYNCKLLWVVPEKDRYLIVDQLEPKAWIYTPQALEKEASVGEMKPYMPQAMGLQVRHWVEPVPVPETEITDYESLRWWRSWSRINFFGSAGDGYILGYEIPDPEEALQSYQVIQRLDKRGKIIGEPRILEGTIITVRDNLAYLFREEDDDDGFSYLISAYDF